MDVPRKLQFPGATRLPSREAGCCLVLTLTAGEATAQSSSKPRSKGLSAPLASVTARLPPLEQDLGSAGPDSLLEERIRRIEASTAQSPELSEDLVSAGDFPELHPDSGEGCIRHGSTPSMRSLLG